MRRVKRRSAKRKYKRPSTAEIVAGIATLLTVAKLGNDLRLSIDSHRRFNKNHREYMRSLQV